MAAPQSSYATESSPVPSCPTPKLTMERILWENTAVGRQLQGTDTKISDLAAETKSILTHITGFQDKVEGVERRLAAVEDRLNTIPDRDQEPLYL
ncbi:hypothetical protein NDU88_001001 [Pleurodeles waltl]|uniref:Uncharacterized protein n=1 Tax=Pleurodeles waltl TaxID=8319 RepID=A0AAV7N9K7_PLEWA|nr:hypothetical protein NDU88_001001 [Pleurodeles waltl]